MKAIGAGLIVSLLFASAASAGDPATGKICAFNYNGFIPNGTYNGAPCKQSMYVTGNDGPNLGVPQVRVLAVGPPPFVVPACQRGREAQVLVQPLSGQGSQWIFPRYLNCP